VFRLPSLPSLPGASLVKLPGLGLLGGNWLVPNGSTGSPRMKNRSARIRGRLVSYGIIEGDGETVVLVHGWGLAHSSYALAAERLAASGYRVVVPDLPGFGRSTDLPLSRMSFERFASVLAAFLRELGAADSPVHLVGHSFGGAVSAQTAADHPELVRSVVLVSSVSGATWMRGETDERLLTERPLWDWGVHLLSEFPLGHFPHAAQAVLRDLGHNVAFHLPTMGIVAALIRNADLRPLLGRVAESGVPCAVVWAAGDQVVTKACFDDQCSALGCEGRVVEGNHGWPLADPKEFGRVIGEVLEAVPESTASVATPLPV
jgi:pimeloyl-ACP methyl ester carboxylesterase